MPRRKRRIPRKISKTLFDSESSDQSSLTAKQDKRQCIDQTDRLTDHSDLNSVMAGNGPSNNSSSFSQYTPLTSTPGVSFPYQQFPPFLQPPPFQLMISPGVETL